MEEDIYLSWQKEFSDLDLGDPRLTKRFLTVLNDLSLHPPASLYASSAGVPSKMKAAYRLMDHEKLEVENLWSHHQQKTMERINQHPVVLLISDTTVFNFENHPAVRGLGRIGKKLNGLQTESQGLHCHNILAVTPKKLPLGILDQQIYARKPKEVGAKKVFPASMPYLEKESCRWVLNLAKSVQGSESVGTKLIAVSDRESDINAYLGSALDLKIDFVVRSRLARVEHETRKKLSQFMSELAVQGSFKLDVIKRNRKTGCRRKPTERLKRAVYRTAELEVKWSDVALQVENIFDEKRIERLRCISVKEKNPPTPEDRIEWMLVTSLKVESFKKATEVIEYYSVRWIIEVFHKMLKTGGCDVEKCCLQTRERIERYITLESLVALRLTQLTYYQRCYPEASCTLVVDELSWQTAYCITNQTSIFPDHPPTAGEFTTMVAKLGGYLNRNSDPWPGGIVLRRGWERLQDMRAGYELFKRQTCG